MRPACAVWAGSKRLRGSPCAHACARLTRLVQRALADKAKGVGGPAVTRIEPAEKCSVWNYQVRTCIVHVYVRIVSTICEVLCAREGWVARVELQGGGGTRVCVCHVA